MDAQFSYFGEGFVCGGDDSGRIEACHASLMGAPSTPIPAPHRKIRRDVESEIATMLNGLNDEAQMQSVLHSSALDLDTLVEQILDL